MHLSVSIDDMEGRVDADDAPDGDPAYPHGRAHAHPAGLAPG